MFKVGDRVIYAHKNVNYTTKENNPLVGTKFFCEGFIVSLRAPCSAFEFDVAWDNGSTNVYKTEDLEFVTYIISWEV